MQADSSVKSEIMEIAWRDFIDFASRTPEIVARFNAENGRSFMQPVSSPLDRMIDDATGKTDDDAREFVFWATSELWGEDCAPAAMQTDLAAWKRERGGGKEEEKG